MARRETNSAGRSRLLTIAPGLAAAETLFDALNDILFCIKDHERKYVGANMAFVRAAGLKSRSELLGRTATGLFPAGLAAAYEQQDDVVFATGNPIQNRLEMITRTDGAIGWFVSQKIPVYSPGGEIVALAGMSRDIATPAEAGAALDPLAAALGTIEANYVEPLRMLSLAKSAGYSVSQFERKVREYTGLSPRQLLTKTRIEAAAHALRDTSKPLKEIAIDCGFYDQASFSRQFREATGTSPGEYRKAFQRR